MPKLAAFGLAAALCAAGLRTAIIGPTELRQVGHAWATEDLGAESFAEAFVRAYLTWDSAHPERHERQVGAFTSDALEPGAGLSVPANGVQQVLWTAATRDEAVSSTRRLVTVAAQTTSGPPYYVTVSVQRDRRGFMAVSAYPAVVGAPPVDTKLSPGEEPEVEDGELQRVVRRGIANYLSRQGENLRADLDRQAVVALPGAPLKLRSIDALTWVRPGRVAVEVQAEGRGTSWTLRYQLDVVKRERWYLRSIETNPSKRRF
jgi:Conjugative transposon protein TcpC